MAINTGVGEVGPVPPASYINVVDNALGLEIYAEGPQTIMQAGDMVSIALYSPRMDPGGTVYRAIVARITLPTSGANRVATDILDFLDKTTAAKARETPPMPGS